jgi:hypothetical protein
MKLNKEYIKVGTLAVCNDEDTTQIYIIDWLSDDKFECTLSYYSPNGKRWGGSGNSFPVSLLKKPNANQLYKNLNEIYIKWAVQANG